MIKSIAEMNRLRWRCTHRAMLEMDLLLGDFLEKHFSNLDPDLAAAFIDLAEMEDPDLWSLITGRRECGNETQARVVAMLKKVRLA